MINQLFEAISIKINSIFPNTYIYFNKIEQGFQTPAFFVKCLKVDENKMISNRYKIFTSFEISYFYDNDNFGTEENNQIIQDFIDNFELLPFQDSFLRSQNISFSTEDSILKISLDYSFYINKNIETSEKMKNLFY